MSICGWVVISEKSKKLGIDRKKVLTNLAEVVKCQKLGQTITARADFTLVEEGELENGTVKNSHCKTLVRMIPLNLRTPLR
ncbi:hypothetical protein RUM43_000292 [Polyplax serrata]|uniref:Uncharacterized protein n=1 Tax=Polyplax serrata TaxID=468196 RepID=A0AAN8SCL8_POLSC